MFCGYIYRPTRNMLTYHLLYYLYYQKINKLRKYQNNLKQWWILTWGDPVKHKVYDLQIMVKKIINLFTSATCSGV